MPVREHTDYDPKIKVRHALAFFNNRNVDLATAIGAWPSHVSIWAKEPDQLIPPLHAYRLREKHPEIMLAAADMQDFEDQETADHKETVREASRL